ncbi:XdhC/CoxI family protein [Rhodoferax sp.]|uniref:XdhC family protein n=1 Tax=Rhodoferax sp. TaxID=50421 RepID=UPI00283CBFC1|nr:XdhC/CoxI family protein [Rhodoferax sp.]MDR3370921.1 XdhC/CoxI family protein [Rhodoferax sp.]
MDLYEEIVNLRQQGRTCALASIINTAGSIPSSTTAKMLVRDDGSIVGTIGGGAGELEVIGIAREVIQKGKPQTISFNLTKRPGIDAGMVCGGSLDVFVEPIIPNPTLYIFGAGHTGLATYRIARSAGFDVVMVDERKAFANRERYPDAKDIVVAELDQATLQLAPTPASFIVSLTPGHQTDMRVLRWAIGTKACYIGMMGSKRKVTGIFQELQKEGIPAESFSNVHAPIGLNIGADTPEEIAVSIVAELIACRRHCDTAIAHLGLPSTQGDVRLKKVG